MSTQILAFKCGLFSVDFRGIMEGVSPEFAVFTKKIENWCTWARWNLIKKFYLNMFLYINSVCQSVSAKL